MIRKICALLLVTVMIAVCAGCGTQEQVSEAVSGGWEIVDNEAVSLPDEVQAAFDKAAEEGTTPVAYIASQVVAGTNYMILCEKDSAYQIAVIYQDLEGNAELTKATAFDPVEYTEGEGAGKDTEGLAGGWQMPEEITEAAIPDEAAEAFGKAAGGDTVPMALLATQVVAGTNYAFLCRNDDSVQVVTVYADLDGNAEITNTYTLDPGEYND